MYVYIYIYTSKVITILERQQEILKRKWFRKVPKDAFKTFLKHLHMVVEENMLHSSHFTLISSTTCHHIIIIFRLNNIHRILDSVTHLLCYLSIYYLLPSPSIFY